MTSSVMLVLADLVLAVGLEINGMLRVSPGPPLSSESPKACDSTRLATTTLASTASRVLAVQSSGM